MKTTTPNKKWIRKSIGVLLLILLGYLLFTSLPLLITLAANTLYMVILAIAIIGLGYLIYRLFR